MSESENVILSVEYLQIVASVKVFLEGKEKSSLSL